MKFVFGGGAREVGGSCIYLRTENKGILFDAGIRQGGNKDPLPDFRSIQEAGGIDYILVSHAHMDHTGSLPVISKAYPDAPIYMTPMTMDLTRILLADSIKLMNRAIGEIPLYSEEDVNAMMARIIPVPYETPYKINDDLSFTFYAAGHIAGAACVYLQCSEGSVFYSGDISTFRQETIEGMRIPRLRPDVGLFESTYGNRLHANRDGEEQKLVDTVKECVQKGYKILIPSFALGRAQEVLLILQKAMRRKELPEVPVYVDGMVRDITAVYLQHPLYLRTLVARKILKGQNPFYSENVQPVSPGQDREELLNQNGAAIFVASSGMLTGGPSLLYAKKMIPDEKACIIITGYQDEDAPGRVLLSMLGNRDQEQTVSLDGQLLPVHCQVEQVGLSAHSDKSELMALIERLSCRRIILVHGDHDAMDELGSELSNDYRVHVYEPSVGSALTINIHTPREQISYSFQNTMHGADFKDPFEQKAFYNFWNEHYHFRSFTVQELYAIYTGRKIHIEKMSEDEKQALQDFTDILSTSVYFSRDPKRMFLYRTNTEEEIQDAEKEKQPQMQDVEETVRKALSGQKVRKISYYQETKTVRIQVDFPDSFDSELLSEISGQVLTKTGWNTELSPAMNHQAAASLLLSFFSDRVVKISHYDNEKRYQVQLSSLHPDDAENAEQFQNLTGWSLNLEEQTGPSRQFNKNVPAALSLSGKPMEQNAAISYIRSAFSDCPVQPYRISIKTDQFGRYLELSFISPMLGHICDDLIKKCSDSTHWRLSISPSVNQNEAQIILNQLAAKYNITLEKQPSYMPGIYTMAIKTKDEIPSEMIQEFSEKTGLGLKKK